jgi:isoquinoline 1-oxidoreductase alpha subunit
MPITLTVNGQRRDLDVATDTPLLWVLRDSLGLLGTKYGCGAGLCGACTVLVNGAAVRSCTVTVDAVASERVTTIEGLSRDGSHQLQRAWVEEDVPQCGYCQAGQIMNAAALLSATPRPTDDQIKEAMAGNLCRCGTYLRIQAAIRRAASGVRS